MYSHPIDRLMHRSRRFVLRAAALALIPAAIGQIALYRVALDVVPIWALALLAALQITAALGMASLLDRQTERETGQPD